jgi:hypothetical protein
VIITDAYSSKGEELVHAGNEDGPGETDDSSTGGNDSCLGRRSHLCWHPQNGLLNTEIHPQVQGALGKIWVIVDIDGNLLRTLDQVCQLLSNPRGRK